MIDRLEEWIAFENRQWRDLVTTDDGTPAIWADLVRRSAPHVKPTWPYSPRWEANSAFTPSLLPEYYGLPDDLAAEWAAYRDQWDRFLDLNPRCRIADMMSEISEANDSSSWPYGWEDDIQAWVRGGFRGPEMVPWDERIKADGWREQFADAATRAPDGWVYYEDGVYSWR